MSAIPFSSAEECWFWAVRQLRRRYRVELPQQVRLDQLVRPCTPEDVTREIDWLFRNGQLAPNHLRVLHISGEAQKPPVRSDYRALWDEAMAKLLPRLEARDIVFVTKLDTRDPA